MFLHGHQRSARSWGIAPVQKLLQSGDVNAARCDQFQCGATTWTHDGGRAPIHKPPRFMQLSLVMLQQLVTDCHQSPSTSTFAWGGRAADAAHYQLKLMKAILRGMQLARDQSQHAKSLLWDDWGVGMIMSAVPVENDLHNNQPTTNPTPSPTNHHTNQRSPT